jgi:hypothetical protein
MSALPVVCRSANEGQYHTLLASFDAAYRNMKNSSEGFNSVLLGVPAEFPEQEGRSRIDRASRAYENAREEFQCAVAKLNEFLIGQIISSRSTIQAASHG